MTYDKVCCFLGALNEDALLAFELFSLEVGLHEGGNEFPSK